MSSFPEHYDAPTIPPENKPKRRRRLIVLVLGLAALALVCVCLVSLIALGLDDLNQLPMLVSGVDVDTYTIPHALSDEQEHLIGLSGYPDSFTILFYDDDFGGTSTRLETWIYSGEGLRYTFINGSEDASESFAPLTGEIIPAPYKPEQFSAYMSLKDILATTDLDEFLLLPLEEELVPGGESYFADRIAFGLKNGELMYVEAIGFAGEDSGVAAAEDEPADRAEAVPTAEPAPATQPAPTAEPATSEWVGAPVVFVSASNDPNWPDCEDTDEGCNTELLLMYPDDPNFVDFIRLTANYDFKYVQLPDISHDGTRIAFAGQRSDTMNIYTIDINGSNLTQLTSDTGWNFRPAWAHDDLLIAYISNRDGEDRWNIFFHEVATGRESQFTSGQYNDRFVAWSPDGDQLVFVSDLADPNPGVCFPDCEMGLYQFIFSNEELASLDVGMTQIGGPAISPDGRYIAFHGRPEGGNWGIYIFDFNTDRVRHFSDMPGEHWFSAPRWSPDGERLVFTTLLDPDSNNYDIAISPVDTFDPLWYTGSGAADYDADW